MFKPCVDDVERNPAYRELLKCAVVKEEPKLPKVDDYGKRARVDWAYVEKPEPELTRYWDAAKLARVDHWVGVENPVIATCRCCGYRGLVDKPEIGIYKRPKPIPAPSLWDYWMDD